jgi:hypothetical protein
MVARVNIVLPRSIRGRLGCMPRVRALDHLRLIPKKIDEFLDKREPLD